MRIRLAIALTLMAALVGVGAGSATAAVSFGSDLSQAPNNSGACFTLDGTSCTLAIEAVPEANRALGGVVAPADGVIVGWKIRSGPSVLEVPFRLHVLTGNSGRAIGPLQTLDKNGGLLSYAAQIPVKKGDRLALDFPEVPSLFPVPVINSSAGSGASFDLWEPVLGAAETRAPWGDNAADAELLLQATLEFDADNDGLGDETQDKCPTSAAPACPPAPIPTEPVPNTKVSEVRIEGAKATFRFSATVKGSTFRCKLDKKPWKRCKSPKVYRGLKEGRHSFKVKAIGPTAVPDPTPAKRSFKVG